MSTILLEIRSAASTCSDAALRQQLRDCADDIARLVKQLAAHCTAETMIALNGAWARGQRLMVLAEIEDDDGGGGGAMPLPERLAA